MDADHPKNGVLIPRLNTHGEPERGHAGRHLLDLGRPAAEPTDLTVPGEAPYDDLIERLILGPSERPLPTGRAYAGKRFAVYARYSTNAQDFDSIKRQIRCCRKYLNSLGVTEIEEFIDEGRTATNAVGREKLQELLKRVDEFDAICFEHYSRWSRETYDGAEICEFLEEKEVEVHSALLGQRLDKEDIIRGVMDAERDVKTRRAWTSGGLDELVYAGGIPGGPCYGFCDSGTPGFPDRHPVEVEAVVKVMTWAAAGMTDARIAERLAAEGYLTPSGTLDWAQGGVLQIRRRILYTGRIRYRQKGKRTIRRKGSSKLFRRTSSQIVRGYNENYRLVSDELFFRANNKGASRKKGEGDERQSLHESALVHFATCDCPGVKQRFFTARSHARPYMMCGLARKRHGCARQHITVDYVLVEREVVRAIRSKLAQYDGGRPFAEAYETRLGEVLQHNQDRRSELVSRLRAEEEVADDMMRRSFREQALNERAARLLAEQEAKVAKLKAAVRGMADLSPALRNVPGRLAELRRALDLVETRLPFTIESQSDALFVESFRKMVPRVLVECHDTPFGALRMRIEFHPEGAFFEGPVAVSLPPPVILHVEAVVDRRYAVNQPAQERSEERARSGLHALTDEQWLLVRDLMPPLPAKVGPSPSLQARAVVNAIVFKLREGIPLRYPPEFFGERRELYNAMQRFIYVGVVEMLCDVIGSRDPSWLEGLSLDTLGSSRRSPRLARRGYVSPIAAARLRVRDGVQRLTAAQWGSVKALVPRNLANPRGGSTCGLTARQICEAMLLKVVTGAPWDTLAELLCPAAAPGNSGLLLRRAAGRAAHAGVWDRIVDAWQREHPDLLRDADMAPIEALKRAEQHRLGHLKSSRAGSHHTREAGRSASPGGGA